MLPTRGTVAALVAMLVACGAPTRDGGRGGRGGTDAGTDTPDAGDTTPDAGDTTPDGGGTTPDAGNTTPDGGTNPANRAPTATAAPLQGTQSGDVVVRLLLFDSDADRLSLSFEYATGDTFLPATTSSALANLEASPAGVEHTLVWRSASDLFDRRATVTLRVTPRDPFTAGQAAVLANVDVDNRRPNVAPTVRWDFVPTTVRGDTTFSFTATDDDADPVTPSIEWRIANGSWRAPTFALAPPARVNAAPGGVQASFTWASAADVPANEPQVQLRVRLDDGRATSSWVETSAFAVNNAPFTRPAGARVVEVNLGEAADWFDLRNASSTTVNLRGWTVRWGNGVDSGSYTLSTNSPSATYDLQPGATVTLTDESPGSTPGTIYLGAGANVRWGATVEGFLAVSDAQGSPVDFVRWSGSREPAPAPLTWTEPVTHVVPHDGTSLVRKAGADTLSSADWCVAPYHRGATQEACLPAPPAGTRLRLTELSSGADSPQPADPTSAPDWVELVNAGSASVDLRDWSLSTNDGTSAFVVVFPTLTVPARGRVVVRELNGASTSTTFYAGESKLAVGGYGTARLLAPNGQPLDYVLYGRAEDPSAMLGWPPDQGAPAPTRTGTLARTSETFTGTGDASPSRWCVTDPSPGAAAGACRPPPNTAGLRLSEVHSGEVFLGQSGVELLNAGAATVDLEGANLSIAGSLLGGAQFGGVTIVPGGRYVVRDCGLFGQGDCYQLGLFGGLPASGSAELTDSQGRSLDFVRWGGSTTTPSPGGTWSETAVLAPNGITTGGSLGRRGTSDTNTNLDWCLQAASLGNANGACTN